MSGSLTTKRLALVCLGLCLGTATARSESGATPSNQLSAAGADLIIRHAYRDVLGRDPDAVGLTRFRALMLEKGWTEKKVREDIRKSPEYSRNLPEEIIRRAYKNLLKREPLPEEFKHYRLLILERGWTEPKVLEDLRKSLNHAP